MDETDVEIKSMDSTAEEVEMDTEQSVINLNKEKDQLKNENITETSTSSSVMASSSVIVPTILVSLHPLVIMNISEHWTRLRAQKNDPAANFTIIGAFIGKQSGRNIEIMNSFELKFDIVDSKILIDSDYYQLKEQQFKQVFPDLDFLGWYTNGESPNEADMKIHHQIIVQIHESPLFLKMNPLADYVGLPIKLYESIIDLVNGVPTMLFVNIPYTLATEEAERIGLDHMARMTATTHNGKTTNSVVSDHLRVQYNAVKMLRDRIRLIIDFINDTRDKKIPMNHTIMRDIFNLCNRLPIVCSDGFNEDFYIQCNDVALLAYLGALTKCSNTIHQYVGKLINLMDRQGTARRTIRMG
ncbi:COP9 signalosome complex subunit 6 [Blomia tropicalis]|nr:COP9 signalosome complex subunit 6 [Blomia tropicalis]